MHPVGLVTEIVEWVGPAFQGVLGYAIVGLVVLMERALFLSLFVPGDLVLALGGRVRGARRVGAGGGDRHRGGGRPDLGVGRVLAR